MSAGVSAVAGGAWALVPVGRVHGLPRAVLVGVPAVVVAAAMATHQRVGAAPEGEVPLRAAVVVPAAAGGLVAFTHWAALALDHSVEAFLVHHGVRRPRVVMAAVAAVVTPLLIGLDRSADRDGRGSQASA